MASFYRLCPGLRQLHFHKRRPSGFPQYLCRCSGVIASDGRLCGSEQRAGREAQAAQAARLDPTPA
jgi:hypothetical protein